MKRYNKSIFDFFSGVPNPEVDLEKIKKRGGQAKKPPRQKKDGSRHLEAGFIPQTLNEVKYKIQTRSRPNSATGCIEWTGAIDSQGYARLGLKDKSFLAHRLSYELTYGPIPEGLDICHKCDNPKCINCDHLFAGTPQENIQDAWKKGRARTHRGEKNNLARLAPIQVYEIRKRLRPYGKETSISLAKEFGMHHSTILKIGSRLLWKHLPEQAECDATCDALRRGLEKFLEPNIETS